MTQFEKLNSVVEPSVPVQVYYPIYIYTHRHTHSIVQNNLESLILVQKARAIKMFLLYDPEALLLRSSLRKQFKRKRLQVQKRVHGSAIHNTENQEATQVSNNKEAVNPIMVHHGILPLGLNSKYRCCVSGQRKVFANLYYTKKENNYINTITATMYKL